MDREKIRKEIDEQVNFGGVNRLGLVPINNLLWIVDRVERETAKRCAASIEESWSIGCKRREIADHIRKEFGLDKPGDEKTDG